jgi:putative alpha-1,2-mannosidase
VGNGKKFIIEARDVSSENKYIQSALLNGEPLNFPWFNHSDLAKGGILVLQMGSRPNEEWGRAH